MRKNFLTFLLVFLVSYGSGHATTCVPKTMDSAPSNDPRYLLMSPRSFAYCGTSGNRFYDCNLNTFTIGYDRYVYQCTKTGWKQVPYDNNTIKDCDPDLVKVEKTYNGLSTSIDDSDYDKRQHDWVLYYKSTNDDNFVGIQQNAWCKYPQTDFEAASQQCIKQVHGNFLHWTGNNVVLCEPVEQIQIVVTVKDAESEQVLDGVQIKYKDTYHDEREDLLTDSSGQATIEIYSGAKKQLVHFHKDGYVDTQEIISPINSQSNPVIELTPLSESQNTTDSSESANDCTNTKWRDANCEKSDDIYDGDGLFYCPFIIKKGDKTQEQNFDKQGCQGFASDKHCWMHEVDSIYKRFCFDEANNKVVVVDHIACPGTDNEEAVVAYIDNTYQLSEDEYGTCVELINEEEEENITNPNDQDVRQENDGKQTLEEETDTDRSQELEEKLKSAKDALAAAKEKENSWANRALGAASTAATSLGAMQLAEGIAERKADTDAEKQMRNYITTMKCEYGGGQGAVLGNEEITLPGGNELLEYYTEYKTLADNLKTTKAALGLSAGIESEVLYDRAQSGLYQYASTGKTGGGETSLYRALTDSESADATAWNDQKDASTKKLYIGGGAAAVGVVGGTTVNYFINRDKKEKDTKK